MHTSGPQPAYLTPWHRIFLLQGPEEGGRGGEAEASRGGGARAGRHARQGELSPVQIPIENREGPLEIPSEFEAPAGEAT